MVDLLPGQSSKSSTNPQKKSSLFDLRAIDKSIYFQLVALLGIALLIAAVLYVGLRFWQEREARGQFATGEAQTDSQTEDFSQIQQQASLDQQRKNDIATINSVLKTFYLKEKKAPDSLKELVPDPLKKLPTDPATKKEYSYNPAQDKQSWQLSATLSNGTKFEVKGP